MEKKVIAVENVEKQEPGKSGKTSVMKNIPQNIPASVSPGGDTLKRLIPEPEVGSSQDAPEPPDYTSARLQQLLGGKYRFEKLIGRGGFALVYKVINLKLNRVEALKVLTNLQSGDHDFAGRFIEEARVSASLVHPNIIQVYEFGHMREFFWFSMQYIEGPTLAMELKARASMDEIPAVNLILPLLDALDYSHKRGVVHRDIKPGNVMLDLSGRPYLMDFGIAKSMDSQFQTKTGQFLGTPIYVSPEQVSGQRVDGRSDIYSIGVMLYEMLTGKYPFPSENSMHALVLRMTNDPIPLSESRPGTDPEVEAIIMRALEKEKENRFASAAELQISLLNFMGDNQNGQPIEVLSWSPEMGEDSPITRLRSDESVPTLKSIKRTHEMSPVSKRSLRWYQVAVAVLIVAVTGLFILMQSSDPPADSSTPGPANTGPAKADVKPDSGAPAVTPLKQKTPSIKENTPGTAAGKISDESTPDTTPKIKKNTRPTGNKTTRAKQPATKPKKQKKEVILPRRAFVMPEEIEGAEIDYTSPLPEACKGQYVNLRITVGADGRVIEAKILSRDSPPECADAFEDARKSALKYIYKPALDAEGNPVRTTMAIAVQLL